MTTTKKTAPKAAPKAAAPENAIKLTKKDAELLEALSADLNEKPENVIKKALAALKQIESDKKYFGVGKLLEAGK